MLIVKILLYSEVNVHMYSSEKEITKLLIPIKIRKRMSKKNVMEVKKKRRFIIDCGIVALKICKNI